MKYPSVETIGWSDPWALAQTAFSSELTTLMTVVPRCFAYRDRSERTPLAAAGTVGSVLANLEPFNTGPEFLSNASGFPVQNNGEFFMAVGGAADGPGAGL